MTRIRSTTVLGIRHNGEIAVGADGQATMDKHVAKNNVRKIRKLLDGKVVAGFAGSTADAFMLLDRFEERLTATAATSSVRPSSWPRTGAKTSTCASWKP